jgi:glycosyltransferase involved in cell wall biosynthesis
VARPVRVLHVMNNASGGAALSTLALMTALRAEGIASAAACHAVGSDAQRQAILEVTRGETIFLPLHSWNRKFRTPWHQRPLKALRLGLRTGWGRSSARHVAEHARRVGADLIHTNTILNPEGGLAARGLQLPHVWHLRELVGPGKWFQLPLEGAALGRFLEARCSMLVANSETAAAAVRAGLPDGLLAVVPNGIDLSAFDRRPRGARRVVVGMVANLGSHVKKHALFIDAAARIDPRLDVEFKIFGAGPADPFASGDPYVRQLCARIEQHGLRHRLTFAGYTSEPATIMSALDILVHPSDLESFGRIVVEAMAAARPVVGVRGGGVAEIVEDGVTGLLAPPDDAAELATHVRRLIEDPALRARMGASGYERAREHYSIETHVARMLSVYEACMSRPVGAALAA